MGEWDERTQTARGGCLTATGAGVPLDVPTFSGAIAQMPIKLFYDVIARLEPNSGGRIYLKKLR